MTFMTVIWRLLMELCDLVTLVKGTPLYDKLDIEDGLTMMHSYNAQESMLVIEVRRCFIGSGFRMVKWSQILMHGKLMWTPMDWLLDIQGNPVSDYALLDKDEAP